MRSDGDWLISGFGDVYPAHVSAFVDLMVVLRRQFDGDLDMMLILAVIGDRRVWQHAAAADVSYGGFVEPPLSPSQAVSINVLSIANFNGMSRETVRLKVAALIDRSWVEREENGDPRPTRKAALDLQAGTDATIDYLRCIVGACDRARSRNSAGSSAHARDVVLPGGALVLVKRARCRRENASQGSGSQNCQFHTFASASDARSHARRALNRALKCTK